MNYDQREFIEDLVEVVVSNREDIYEDDGYGDLEEPMVDAYEAEPEDFEDDAP